MKRLSLGLKTMIFEKLFKKAYQSKDPQTRIEAINTLDPNVDKDKQILHELAFNDSDAKVSIKALDALNSFTLYLKAYENHMHAGVKVYAERQLPLLLESGDAVSDTLFKDLFNQGRHHVLTKALLFSSDRLLRFEELALDNLFKLANEAELRRFYEQRASESLKLKIVQRLSEQAFSQILHANDKRNIDYEKLLRRMHKGEASSNMRERIENILSEIESEKQKPIAIRASAKLINSKLLALADSNDYLDIDTKRNVLLKEFEQIKSQFSYLSEDERSQITATYMNVKEKAEKRLSSLEADYMGQQHLKGISDAIADIRERASTVFQQIDILLNADSDEQLDSQIDLLTSAINDLHLELNDLKLFDEATLSTAAHKQEAKKLLAQFDDKRQALEALPDYIERNKALDAYLQEVNGVVLAEDTDDTDEAVNLDERIALMRALISDGVSEQREAQFNTFLHSHKQAKQSAIAEKKQTEKRCMGKLSAVKRLVDQGKFKAAIGTFHAAQSIFESLQSPSKVLTKRYEQAQKSVQDLKDWQSYIAAPRKPEIIARLDAIVNDDIARDKTDAKGQEGQTQAVFDVEQRAEEVKQLRHQFSSLGKLNTSEDDALNEKFEQLIEQAFAPCREHFKAREKLRENNAATVAKLMEALKALENVEDIQVLNKHVQALTQEYRNIGELDRNVRRTLHKDYLQAIKPLNDKIHASYNENMAHKERLIKQAQKLNELSDIQEAVEQAKALQQTWKTIGFAGKKHDKTLWDAFRKANDQIFNQLKQQNEEHKAAVDAQYSSLLARLETLQSELDQRIEKIDEKSDKSGSDSDVDNQTQAQLSRLHQLNESLDHLRLEANALPKPLITKVSGRLKALQTQISENLMLAEKAKKSEQLDTVFSVIQSMLLKNTQSSDAQDNDQAAFDNLPAKYKTALLAAKQTASSSSSFTNYPVLADMDRNALFYALDILAKNGELSPDSSEKKQVQLALMAAKLEGQNMPEPEDVFAQWIAKGPLDSKASEQLQAIKPLLLD